MISHERRHDERGMALVMVMLLTVAVAALAAGAIFLTSSANLVSRGHEREEDMRNAADAGIELGRSALNGTPTLFPDTGYQSLFVNQPVLDASGAVIPGVTRSVYYGPTGSATGQYGIFGSVVSVIQDPSGAVVVRRGELAQESFAKFAYYTNSEGTGICFGGGDQIFGPLHTNANMCIYSSGARFRSTVEVAGTITGASYGTFDQGYTERGAIIPLPTIADLAKLNTYATTGGMSYTAPTGGTSAQARLRVEFLALDLDGDGRVSGPEEGFYRIYEDTGATNIAWMMASRIAAPDTSRNCGHYHDVGGGRLVFFTAWHHRNWTAARVPGHVGTAPPSLTSANESLNLTSSGGLYRCFLGGDERLQVDTVTTLGPLPRNTFRPGDVYGRWRQFTAAPDPAVVAGLKNLASGTVDTTLANRQILAQYLFPLSRRFNPNSKGVLYVTGKVALSGTINSRITIAANDNIIIADDLRYAITPGSAPCLGSNILGLLSPDSIFVSDNTLNAPWSATGTMRNYDDSNDEFFQGVLLTLGAFTVENYGTGATSGQPCQTTSWGRGCLFLTGGIIQATRGAVGTTAGTGYVKRYSYDVCAFETPPPYFPTTGRFIRNRYYEIDPVGFNVRQFFEDLAPRY